MSLKAFHILFIAASVLLTLGFGAWSLYQYFSNGRSTMDLLWGSGSFLLAIALVIYGRYFLKKLKNVEYL